MIKELSATVTPLKYNVLCKFHKIKGSDVTKSGIITPDQFGFKANGSKEIVYTQRAKLHILEIIKIGSEVKDIKVGDFIIIG